ncbi:DUF411 domain-containing protein [Conchiformibius steedae]|nr:DUF411 domain-containing protein [Conchiformibius steedae]
MVLAVVAAAVVSGILSPQTEVRHGVSADKYTDAHQNTGHIEVWKDPNCGCCTEWINHMEKNGFRVTVHNTGNSEIRKSFGMPQNYASCHTAKIDGYIIEGHTPAADVRRLLKEKPDALGLATPGMPLGSPGMDGEMYQDRTQPYDVLLVGKDGSSQVYQSY